MEIDEQNQHQLAQRFSELSLITLERDSLKQQVHKLNETLHNFTQQLSIATSERDIYQQEITELTNRVQDITAELEIAQSINENLSHELSTTSSLLQDAQRSLIAAENQLQSAKHDISALSSETNTAQSQLLAVFEELKISHDLIKKQQRQHEADKINFTEQISHLQKEKAQQLSSEASAQSAKKAFESQAKNLLLLENEQLKKLVSELEKQATESPPQTASQISKTAQKPIIAVQQLKSHRQTESENFTSQGNSSNITTTSTNQALHARSRTIQIDPPKTPTMEVLLESRKSPIILDQHRQTTPRGVRGRDPPLQINHNIHSNQNNSNTSFSNINLQLTPVNSGRKTIFDQPPPPVAAATAVVATTIKQSTSIHQPIFATSPTTSNSRDFSSEFTVRHSGQKPKSQLNTSLGQSSPSYTDLANIATKESQLPILTSQQYARSSNDRSLIRQQQQPQPQNGGYGQLSRSIPIEFQAKLSLSPLSATAASQRQQSSRTPTSQFVDSAIYMHSRIHITQPNSGGYLASTPTRQRGQQLSYAQQYQNSSVSSVTSTLINESTTTITDQKSKSSNISVNHTPPSLSSQIKGQQR